MRRLRPIKQFPKRSKVRSRRGKELRNLSNRWRCRVEEIQVQRFTATVEIPVRGKASQLFIGTTITRAPDRKDPTSNQGGEIVIETNAPSS